MVSLGEEWVVVLAALAGDDTSTATVGHRAVLGGEFLGRTETEVAVLLTPDAVRRVAAELASDSVGGDGEARVLRHLDAVEAAHGATAGDGLRRRVAAQVEALAGFYAVAAAQGDVVVKVAYS
nr:DUF1877 family protein [Streptomyces sp. SID8379]